MRKIAKHAVFVDSSVAIFLAVLVENRSCQYSSFLALSLKNTAL